jgi:hypothetical protein
MPSFSDYAARNPHSYGTGTGTGRGLAGPAQPRVTCTLVDATGAPVPRFTPIQFEGLTVLIDHVNPDGTVSGLHEVEHYAQRGWRRFVRAEDYGWRVVVVPA